MDLGLDTFTYSLSPFGTKPGFAEIVAHRHQLLWDRAYTTYVWVGKTTQPARVCGRQAVVEAMDLPWPVRVVEYDFVMQECVVLRTDVLLGVWAWVYTLLYLLRHVYRLLRHRIVLTAMVWDRAYVPFQEEPHWHHLGKRRP